MSDSGRQIGDCKHGKNKEYCLDCCKDWQREADARLAESLFRHCGGEFGKAGRAIAQSIRKNCEVME